MTELQTSIAPEPQVYPRVLLMEDELSVARGLQMVLSEEGYGVDLAMTGGSALDTFGKKQFDLLVADLRLPDMDGMEVIKRVKAESPATGVIVITGYATVSSAVEAMKSGAVDYLPKPFTEDEFKAAVQSALKDKFEVPAPDKKPAESMSPDEKRVIQRQEVIRVLNRSSHDSYFWRELMEKGSRALKGYQLSLEAKAAIVSGDLKWMKEHVGDLTPEQLRFINKCLEKEVW
jgi:CheY-like chemotaxis protein